MTLVEIQMHMLAAFCLGMILGMALILIPNWLRMKKII